MTPIVIDSSVWVAVLRDAGSPYAPHLRTLISQGWARVSHVVRAEVLPFVRSPSTRKRVATLLTCVPAVDSEKQLDFWERVVDWRTKMVRKGLSGVALPDVIVAVAALQARAPLWTLDSDFAPICDHFPLELYPFDP